MRVLFADDQLPSPSDAENNRYKEELRKELSGKLSDFEAAYKEDYEWFSELVRYLSVDMGFELVNENSFMKAKERAGNRDDYDVAVIDLSWTGDPGLAHDRKKNAGLEILRLIAEGNRDTGTYRPTIAFSQNYQSDLALFATVLETGALPIPKDYTPTGHRSLGAAIKLMCAQRETNRRLPTNGDTITLQWLLGSLSIRQLWALVAAMFSALAGVAAIAYWLGSHLALLAHQ